MTNNYKKAKCFIKSRSGFDEITYGELLLRLKKESAYAEKKFVPLHGMLMEVSEDEYVDFYKGRRHHKYLSEVSIKRGEISFDMLTTNEFNGEDVLIDVAQNVEEQVIKKIILDKLHKVLPLLPPPERKLIHEHFFLDISQVKLAEIYGVNQSTISRRINRILNKLKKIIEI